MAKKSEAAKEQSNRRTRGRPPKYLCEYDEMAKKMCLQGATDVQLSEYFEVSEATINRWKIKYPTFRESIKHGKDYADAQVVYGLYQRAVGMQFPDCHFHCRTISSGKKKGQLEITKTPFVKYIPPDVNAAKFWLKNRRRNDWKDVYGHTDGDGGALGIVINESLSPKAVDQS